MRITTAIMVMMMASGCTLKPTDTAIAPIPLCSESKPGDKCQIIVEPLVSLRDDYADFKQKVINTVSDFDKRLKAIEHPEPTTAKEPKAAAVK